MKEEPKDFDEGEGGVGEGDEGDDADGVGQVLLVIIHHLCDLSINMSGIDSVQLVKPKSMESDRIF